MRALVTGAGGFLGSAISTRLEGEGWQVTRAGRPEVEIPSPAFDDLLVTSAPALVVHCAGPASVPDSVRDPHSDFAGSAGVLEALLDRLGSLAAPPRVLFLSSAAVYGQPERLPVSEEQPLAPISPYGYHRVACELLLREHAKLYDVPAASLRVFSAYGEGLTRQVLWDVCRKALAGGEIVLHGTGEESRDFVHRSDVAQAVALAARAARFEAEAYNVGTGRATEIAELAKLLLAALGTNREIVFSGESRRGDPVRWQADIGLLRTLGFESAVAIEEGARAYARWARTQLGGAA